MTTSKPVAAQKEITREILFGYFLRINNLIAKDSELIITKAAEEDDITLSSVLKTVAEGGKLDENTDISIFIKILSKAVNSIKFNEEAQQNKVVRQSKAALKRSSPRATNYAATTLAQIHILLELRENPLILSDLSPKSGVPKEKNLPKKKQK
ncbi:MAG: hypothetical protein ACJAZX_000434 [Rickettsiales bacterium]|jgi:hypothetical protein